MFLNVYYLKNDSIIIRVKIIVRWFNENINIKVVYFVFFNFLNLIILRSIYISVKLNIVNVIILLNDKNKKDDVSKIIRYISVWILE